MEPATFGLVAHCLNHLHHRVPPASHVKDLYQNVTAVDGQLNVLHSLIEFQHFYRQVREVQTKNVVAVNNVTGHITLSACVCSASVQYLLLLPFTA